MTNTNRPHSPSAEYRYFLYDPNDGHTFYRTPEERDIAAKSLIKDYLSDDGWSEDVVDVYAGEATHQVNEVNRLDRVGTLDEDGYDENGEFFGDADVDYKCDYQLQRLSLLTLAAPDQVPDPTKMVAPPAEGEVGKLVAKLRRLALQNPLGTADPTITRAAALLQQQAAELAMLRRLAAEIEALVSESDGVAGLHLNGDLAPWDELLPGGRFERLTSLPLEDHPNA